MQNRALTVTVKACFILIYRFIIVDSGYKKAPTNTDYSVLIEAFNYL